MSEALAAAVEFGPDQMTLSTELLRVLTAGDATSLKALLRREGRPEAQADSHVASQAAAPPPVGTGCLLGVTSNGNTALHLVASRGHAELAALVCETAPSLVATRNRGLDTPLHCAAKAGSRDVAACLLSRMRAAAAGGAEAATSAAAPLRARNRLSAGCGTANGGDMDNTSGIVGLGRSALSLVSQLGVGRFSYCLRSDADAGASLILFGFLANVTGGEAQSVQ